MSWTSENYPKVREYLPADARQVFDQMANEGKRVREAGGELPTHRLTAQWARAIRLAGVERSYFHVLRKDYITATLEARRG